MQMALTAWITTILPVMQIACTPLAQAGAPGFHAWHMACSLSWALPASWRLESVHRMQPYACMLEVFKCMHR